MTYRDSTRAVVFIGRRKRWRHTFDSKARQLLSHSQPRSVLPNGDRSPLPLSFAWRTINDVTLWWRIFQETRVTLRLLLLQVFGALCALDSVFISELLNSVLPLELARDLIEDVTSSYTTSPPSFPTTSLNFNLLRTDNFINKVLAVSSCEFKARNRNDENQTYWSGRTM